jgi:hypothetical protein
MLPSVEEGMPWPQAMAGVVRPAWVSNHPALAAASASPPYRRRGVFSACLLLMSPCNNNKWTVRSDGVMDL